MKKVIILIVVLMLLGSATYVVLESSYFHIKEIDIFGDSSISEYEILQYAKIKRNMNLLMLDVDISTINLEKHPMIKSAAIKKIYPTQVEIEYELREPIIAVYYSNSFIILDEDLTAIMVNQNEKGLLSIYGLNIENFNLGKKIDVVESNLILASIDIVKLINISNLNFIPSINIINNNIILNIHKDFNVNFGDGKNIEEKYNAFFNIYKELNKQEVNNGVIDVSIDGLPTFRPFGN